MKACSEMHRIITIIGTRPQSIKAAAVSRVLREAHSEEIAERILYTGQHYDRELFQVFFEELNVPEPSWNLNVRSDTQGAQTGEMTGGIEKVLMKERPELVLLYGDTNTTLAGALAASKLHIPVAHVEAGLRSFRKTMPEELNRVLSDHVSSFLFAPTRTAVENLQREGFPSEATDRPRIDQPAVHFSGDVMYDSVLRFSRIAGERFDPLQQYKLSRAPILMTFHRAENTDDPQRLQGILDGAKALVEESGLDLILPLHPRSRKAIEEKLGPNVLDEFGRTEGVHVLPPLSYLEMLAWQRQSNLILTDSGGIQKEAFFNGVPCLVLRDESEWKELVENGNSRLVGASPDRILQEWAGVRSHQGPSEKGIFGDGKAAEYICRTLLTYFQRTP